MSAKTKIVVLHMKEVIYTVIFIALLLVLSVILFIMFHVENKQQTTGKYVPGVYTSSIEFTNSTVEVEVAVDSDHINNIAIADLSETVTTMYPLMQPAIENLKTQILNKQSTENLTYNKDNQYTSKLLIKAIERAVEKAEHK